MRVAEYYTIRRAVQSNAPEPDAGAVAAMETELLAALKATGLFHTVEVGHTDDPDRHVIAMVAFSPEIDTSEAALAIARLWTKQIAYGFWQAQTIRVDKEHVELQGATRFSMRGHYATVHLIAEAKPAPTTQPVPAPRFGALAGRPTPSVGIGQHLPVTSVRRAGRRSVGRAVVA